MLLVASFAPPRSCRQWQQLHQRGTLAALQENDKQCCKSRSALPQWQAGRCCQQHPSSAHSLQSPPTQSLVPHVCKPDLDRKLPTLLEISLAVWVACPAILCTASSMSFSTLSGSKSLGLSPAWSCCFASTPAEGRWAVSSEHAPAQIITRTHRKPQTGSCKGNMSHIAGPSLQSDCCRVGLAAWLTCMALHLDVAPPANISAVPCRPEG